jgi:hypothetical protein
MVVRVRRDCTDIAGRSNSRPSVDRGYSADDCERGLSGAVAGPVLVELRVPVGSVRTAGETDLTERSPRPGVVGDVQGCRLAQDRISRRIAQPSGESCPEGEKRLRDSEIAQANDELVGQRFEGRLVRPAERGLPHSMAAVEGRDGCAGAAGS